jgi:hypothetical protein
MGQNHQNPDPSDSAPFGNLRNDSEGFGKVPNDSESFGTIRKDAEGFRNVSKASERKENHTLTVREAARLFESAGVARTERSIINWCQPNRQGICRLDCYFDPNERKYYLTPQSVETVIAEEKVRATRPHATSEPFGNVPNAAERRQKTARSGSDADADAEAERVKELERENLDLKIANRGKDLFIDQLKTERNGFFGQLLAANRRVGELETKLQIEGPNSDTLKDAEHH